MSWVNAFNSITYKNVLLPFYKFAGICWSCYVFCLIRYLTFKWKVVGRNYLLNYQVDFDDDDVHDDDDDDDNDDDDYERHYKILDTK